MVVIHSNSEFGLVAYCLQADGVDVGRWYATPELLFQFSNPRSLVLSTVHDIVGRDDARAATSESVLNVRGSIGVSNVTSIRDKPPVSSTSVPGVAPVIDGPERAVEMVNTPRPCVPTARTSGSGLKESETTGTIGKRLAQLSPTSRALSTEVNTPRSEPMYNRPFAAPVVARGSMTIEYVASSGKPGHWYSTTGRRRSICRGSRHLWASSPLRR